MLSTQYRLRLEFICKCIANGEEVKLSDMIWANKLAKANTTATSQSQHGISNSNVLDIIMFISHLPIQ